ncbi:MAG: hypothetical protein R3325_00860 [Thermoanaerobaculia bacterium]|nr:hypothetical protein [Thermoanaerobaculia bacterium]
MTRVTALAAVAALFVTGVLVGALATHLFYTQRLLRPEGAPRAMVMGRLFSRQLERSLELTPEQAEQVEKIVRDSHAEADRLRRETFPRVRQIVDEAAAEIEAILTEEQRERFRELRRRQRDRAEQFLLGPPGPGRRRGPGPPPDPPPPRP